ncbi:Zn(2)-C6 fungal-type DNA-binding domain protein [Niveomyces insectorum RCEF 264]|uniref:Zn(2)-C6 fungal-type DNA-binding domain protein n=1 Tax=Niveomyces insectorum RCEF 264 TaxID=1081102 RepID=A0A167WXE1_9HYPO|nr:Zn(2)-C6 fungal-type DNA-binding domain protein [Niveomyces insectorum RCEF 264]
MVGVPGKFKGCETCRLRRVKCDNTRPFCKKCQDTGRSCAGYERETVFIIGTPEDGGRCSSHPPRVIKSKKGTASSSNSSTSGGNSSRTDSTPGPSAQYSFSPTGASTPTSMPPTFTPTFSSAPSFSTGPSPTLFSDGPYLPTTTSGTFSASATYGAPLYPTPVVPSSSGGGHGGGAALNLGVHAGSPELAPIPPLQPAWDDSVVLSSSDGNVYEVQVAALFTRLPSLVRQRDNSGSDHDGNRFVLSPFPQYAPANVQPPPSRADDGAEAATEDFELYAQCIVHLASEHVHMGFGTAPADSICLFLYQVGKFFDQGEKRRSAEKRDRSWRDERVGANADEQHNSSLATSHVPSWKDPAVQHNSIYHAGPSQFVAFPAHHFFARVYRPSAVWAALLNRKSTFLADPEWTAVPWEMHPKSWFDRLLDIVVLVPALLDRADHVLPHPPTLTRRLLALDLLDNAFYVEGLLAQWYGSVQGAAGRGGHHSSSTNKTNRTSNSNSSSSRNTKRNRSRTNNSPPSGSSSPSSSSSPAPGAWYWLADAAAAGANVAAAATLAAAQIPFADPFAFRDATAALMFVTYWAALVLLYPCLANLHAAASEPVLDGFAPDFAGAGATGGLSSHPHHQLSAQLPAHLCTPLSMPHATAPQPPPPPPPPLVPPTKYGHHDVRALAAHVCRSLDFALATTAQPDLLTAPLAAVESFYQSIHAAAGDGALELLWCAAFRSRLVGKGQYMAGVVESRQWEDVAQF